MAPCPNPTVASALILLVLVMGAAEPGIALKLEPTGTSRHIPPLLHCAPADHPAPAATPSNNNNLSAFFRANVLALLGALPPAAAAAPTGSAAAQSSGAFARAFCFGFGARGGSSPGDCLKCLSAAAQDISQGCTGRRGAVWRAGCFLSYADTNASTAHEDTWRGWFYGGDVNGGDDEGSPTAALGGSECIMGNRTAAAVECSRCLNESAQVVPALKEGRQLSLVHGDAVVVVGYACYLRVPLFHPTPRWETHVFGVLGVFDAVAVVLIEIGGLLFCIREAREFNPA